MVNRKETEKKELKMYHNVRNNKKIIVVTVLMLFFMIFVIFPLDDIQQKEYLMVQEAYQELDAEDYASALKKFEQYKNSHSNIFWKFVELMATEDYHYDKIQQAIKECEENID